MIVSQIMEKMIRLSAGNLHDIEHFIKVWSYAKTIAELEELDPETQFILEASSITHDIACPLCRKKYGEATGKLQEKESFPLIEAFFTDTDIPEEKINRIAYIVSHHHTYENVDGSDWQILLEADYIVNAAENHYSRENIQRFLDLYTRTEAGGKLIREIFGLQNPDRHAV